MPTTSGIPVVRGGEVKQTNFTFNYKDDRELELILACRRLAETLLYKNSNYGNSFKEQYDDYGPMSAQIRIDDKVRRLKELIKGDPDKVGESLFDTFLDLAGYGILSSIEANRERT